MFDTPEKPGTSHPTKDRRLHPRQRIHSLSYAKMGDSNGGIVLNISEGGISVQAAAVLDPSESIPMWLEIPRVPDRIEVLAEIVWLSASKKEAGLRFVDLPESALQHIRRWMAREATPEAFEDETDPVYEEQVPPVSAKPVDESEVHELVEENVLSEEEIQEFESEAAISEEIAATENDIEALEAEQPGLTDGADTDEDSETETEIEIRSDAPADENSDEEAESESEAKRETEKETEPEPETEDELIRAFGPPVVPFERRPHAPFSAMNALSGAARASQNLAIAPPFPREIQKPVAPVKIAALPESASGVGWKDFRVQLQTGWFLAALVLLFALISFIAGMAVRRGALNGVLGEQEESLSPKGQPIPGTASGAPLGVTSAASGSAIDATIAAPAKPLSIEIVDNANRRWVIPASAGGSRVAGASQPADVAAATTATTATTRQPAAEGNSQVQSASRTGTITPDASSATGGKPGAPLVLSLPETPISASGSVAIRSQRSVPVPADAPQASQNGRNLQVGQLVNLVEPVYPAEAVQQKIEGTVKLHAVIGTDGKIESLTAVSGPKGLIQASTSAVQNWKYNPTRMNGQAIETQEDITFVFRLPN
jgi:TonB family protein